MRRISEGCVTLKAFKALPWVAHVNLFREGGVKPDDLSH